MRLHPSACLMLAALLGLAPVARAQIPVLDAASLAQLLNQVQTLQSQLATARSQLAQAQSALSTMTGSRGMQLLLGSTVRNYLPVDWAGFVSALANGNPAYASLGASLQTALQANAVLPPQLIALFTPLESAALTSARQSAALLQVSSQQALSRTSSQFASLQQLVSAIGTATDQKAILELVARIVAEQAMVQNEQTKMQVLRQAIDGEVWTTQQRARETAIVAEGQWSSRFQPTTP